MFNMPGGWELIMVMAVIAFLFGGNKALDSLKNTTKDLRDIKHDLKKEVEEIKDITPKI